jgi:hypothetical protein
MKKIILALFIFGFFFLSEEYITHLVKAENSRKSVVENKKKKENTQNNSKYIFPEFYRGIYLNIVSARSMERLKKFVKMAKSSYINTFVLDTQSSRYRKNIVPSGNIKYLLSNGIHPVARIVVFPDGLKRWPVSKKYLDSKLEIAESACIAGFKEIQFDYIRFNDSSRNRHVTLKERYAFIEGFLSRARKHLKKYNIKIAADIFGRIPLNRRDLIGQRMEGLDKVVDIICPMAYPSHYTWSRKYYADPYYTVFKTSENARKRAKNSEIVSYIQAFRMKLSGIPYSKYIREQLKAVRDAKIKGFFFWNARQKYTIPLRVTREFYSTQKVSRREKISAEKGKRDNSI